MSKMTFKLRLSLGAWAVALAATTASAQPTPQSPRNGQLSVAQPPSSLPGASALSYRQSRLGWTSKVFTIRGKLDEIVDGKLIVTQPVSMKFRLEISEHRQIP